MATRRFFNKIGGSVEDRVVVLPKGSLFDFSLKFGSFKTFKCAKSFLRKLNERVWSVKPREDHSGFMGTKTVKSLQNVSPVISGKGFGYQSLDFPPLGVNQSSEYSKLIPVGKAPVKSKAHRDRNKEKKVLQWKKVKDTKLSPSQLLKLSDRGKLELIIPSIPVVRPQKRVYELGRFHDIALTSNDLFEARNIFNGVLKLGSSSLSRKKYRHAVRELFRLESLEQKVEGTNQGWFFDRKESEQDDAVVDRFLQAFGGVVENTAEMKDQIFEYMSIFNVDNTYSSLFSQVAFFASAVIVYKKHPKSWPYVLAMVASHLNLPGILIANAVRLVTYLTEPVKNFASEIKSVVDDEIKSFEVSDTSIHNANVAYANALMKKEAEDREKAYFGNGPKKEETPLFDPDPDEDVDAENQGIDLDLATSFTALATVVSTICGVKTFETVKPTASTMRELNSYLAAANGFERLVSTTKKVFMLVFQYIYTGVTKKPWLRSEEIEFFSRVEVWMKDLQVFLDKYPVSEISKYPHLWVQIKFFHQQGSDFLIEMQRKQFGGVSYNGFNHVWSNLLKLYNALSKEFTAKKRTSRPVCVYIVGDSRFGKTLFTQVLTQQLMLRRDLVYTNDSIYERKLINDQKFWDAYHDHFCTVMDDLFQQTDPQIRANQMLELIYMLNDFQDSLNSAEVENKGARFFNSKLVICSSNCKSLSGLTSMQSITAFQERRDFPISLSLAKKYENCVKQVGNNGTIPDWPAIRKLSGSKNDLVLDAWVVNIHANDFDTQPSLSNVIPKIIKSVTLPEFIDLVDERLKRNENALHNMLEIIPKLPILVAEKKVVSDDNSVKKVTNDDSSKPSSLSPLITVEAVNAEMKRVEEEKKAFLSKGKEQPGVGLGLNQDNILLSVIDMVNDNKYYFAEHSVGGVQDVSKVFYTALGDQPDVSQSMRFYFNDVFWETFDSSSKLMFGQNNFDWNSVPELYGNSVLARTVFNTAQRYACICKIFGVIVPTIFSDDSVWMPASFNEAGLAITCVWSFVNCMLHIGDGVPDLASVFYIMARTYLQSSGPMDDVATNQSWSFTAVRAYLPTMGSFATGVTLALKYVTLSLLGAATAFIIGGSTWDSLCHLRQGCSELVKNLRSSVINAVGDNVVQQFKSGLREFLRNYSWLKHLCIGLGGLAFAYTIYHFVYKPCNKQIIRIQGDILSAIRASKDENIVLECVGENQSIQSGDAQTRKSERKDIPVVHPIGQNQSQDAQGDDTINNIILPNLCEARLEGRLPDGTERVCVQNVLFIRGREFLATAHFFRFDLADAMITFTHVNGNRYSYNLSEITRKRWVDADLITCRLPKRAIPRRSILNHFPYLNELNKVIAETVLVTFNNRLVCKSSCAPSERLEGYRGGSGDQVYITKDAINVKVRSNFGDCGGVYVAQDPKMIRKILGVHTALGSNKTIDGALGVYITQERLHANLFGDEIPITSEMALNVNQCLEPPKVESRLYENLSFVGVYPVAQKVPVKSKIRKSVVHGKLNIPCTAPSNLGKTVVNGQLVDPYQIAWDKWAREPHNQPKEEHLKVLNEVLEFIPSYLGKADQTFDNVVSLEEAINGREGTTQEPIEITTGAGHPYSEWPHSKSGKKEWLIKDSSEGERNHYYLHPKCMLEVEDRLEKAKLGVKKFTLWGDCLKDERVVPGKDTRLFCVGPLDLTIACRQYFMRFSEHMIKNRHRLPVQIGINPDGQEWSRFYFRLSRKWRRPPKWLAGDFKRFDMSLPSWLTHGVASSIMIWFLLNGATTFENLVRWVLIDEVLHSTRLHGRYVYQCHQGVPSGHFLTAIFNSLVNFVIFAVCVLIAARRAGHKDYNIMNFISDFECGFVGDDHVCSMNPDITWFNQQIYQELVSEVFGMIYTDTSKATGELDPFTLRKNLIFLQREFRYDSKTGLVFAPLKRTILDEEINWRRKNDTDDKFVATWKNLDASLRGYFHWGRSEFEMKKEQYNLLQFQWLTNQPPFLYSYDRLLEEWLAR